MFKHACVLIALAATVSCHEVLKPKQQMDDPFTLMDRLVHYVFPPRMKLWPWHDLFQAANPLEDPKLVSNRNKCEIDLYVKRFEPEDLRVKVKNRFIIVEGRKKASEDDLFMVNRFVQNFALPPGCMEDEVTAVYDNGVLFVSAPKHDLPPPPPERNIPIEVRKPAVIETTTEKNEEQSIATSTAAAIEKLDSEATTTHGKIRKKELKTVTKVTKDNEVTKGEGYGLDYSIVEEME
ncbi:Small heat shock protein 27.4 [Operophtera brumata]|uniref:Small heat shock protein 27.4 n=1 Tax=Operophtera brumata TaxID=104452 RepID=A0A0L7L4F0_OPEBR|nr:Small heat shock protein 27.4 [Operophtera brumata]